jgi:hypothetical protein
MKMFTSIRHDWWRKTLSRFMVLTMINFLTRHDAEVCSDSPSNYFIF